MAYHSEIPSLSLRLNLTKYRKWVGRCGREEGGGGGGEILHQNKITLKIISGDGGTGDRYLHVVAVVELDEPHETDVESVVDGDRHP